MKRRLALGIALSLALGAAMAGEVIEVSPGVYMVNVKNWAGMFGSAAGSKAKALKEAAKFAKERGMVAIPINMEVEGAIPGARMGGASYQFRLVPPGSPEAKSGTYLDRSPDQVTEVNVRTQQQPEKPDVYAELLKLDDLRKRGIITEAEFDAAKKRLLSE
jgi:hypothetical protein